MAKSPHVNPSNPIANIAQMIAKSRTDLVERIRAELKSREPDSLMSRCFFAMLAVTRYVEQTFEELAGLWDIFDEMLREGVDTVETFMNSIKFDPKNEVLTTAAREEEELRLRDWLEVKKAPLLRMLNARLKKSQTGDRALVFGTLRNFVEESTNVKAVNHWMSCSLEALETSNKRDPGYVDFPLLCATMVPIELLETDPLWFEAASQYMEREKAYEAGLLSPFSIELAYA